MGKAQKRKVRYAVVGIGNIAQVAVLPAFAHARETSELVALVSSDGEKLAALGDQYGVSGRGTYEELEQVIAANAVDAVYVAVPNTLHREVTERAAAAGAHVLCEKPMATTEQDCLAMIRATAKAGVLLMIAYRLHFDATNMGAVKRIRDGEIGEPRIFSSVFSHQVRAGDIRTKGDLGGGALMDLGIYCVNAARYLFRAEPIEVMAQHVVGRDDRSREVDELTSAILRFPGGKIAQLIASQGAADVAELRVVGTKGDIRLDPAYEYAGGLASHVTKDGHTEKDAAPKRDQFAPELIHFSECILTGREPQPSGLEGLADVRILRAIQESARSGQTVAIEPLPLAKKPDETLAMAKPPVKAPKPVHAPSPSK